MKNRKNGWREREKLFIHGTDQIKLDNQYEPLHYIVIHAQLTYGH